MDEEYKEEIVEDFNQLSSDYYNPDTKELIPYVVELSPSSKSRALDIGCGTGDLSYELSKEFNQVVGIDISDGMLEEARKKYPNLTFRKMDAENISFKEGFDYIVSITTFHHLNISEVIPELKNLLNKDGRIVIIDVAYEPGGKNVTKFLINAYVNFVKTLFVKGYERARTELHQARLWARHFKHDELFTPEEFQERYEEELEGCEIEELSTHLKAVIWEK